MTQLRTLTYTVKMDTSDGKEKAKQFRVTLKTMEQDADKASKQINNLAQTIGKKYATNVKLAIDQSKTVSNEIKAATQEANRAERAYNALTNEYKHLTARTGKTAEQQEKMNALHRLGSNATLTQKKEIIKLVNAQQKQVKVTGQTQKSMRGLRGQAQNLGWQLQDVAVQAQMGTDALVIIGQQGSQLASGFGAMGALVGAGIAVGAAGIGVLSKALKSAEVDTKLFEDRVKSLKTSLDDLNDTTFETSREFQAKTIEQVNKELIALNNNNIKVTKEMTKAAVAYSKFNEFNKAGVTEVSAFNKEMADGQFIIAQNTDSIAKLTELKRLQSIANGRSIEQTIKDEKANKSLVESLADQTSELGKTQREIDLAKAAQKGANKETLQAIKMHHAAIDAYKLYEEGVEGKVKAEKAATATLKKELAEQQKLQQEHINTLAKYSDEGKLIKLQIQYKKERDLLAGNHEALGELEKSYNNERLAISGTFWEKYAVSAQKNLGSFDDQVSNSLDRFSAGFGDAIGNAIFESDNLGEGMANIFKDVGKNMVSFFAEWAAQKLTLWALEQTIGTASQAAAATTMTANAEAMSVMAGLNMFASMAGAPFPINLGAPAAALAATAATAPMAATVSSLAFAGAFDEGGKIPSGMSGIVSEYGDELVGGTMVYNGSPNSLAVTGREDTAKMRSSSTSNTITINSSGNASPEAIARALARTLKKSSKTLDNAVFDSMNRGKRNGGKRFA